MKIPLDAKIAVNNRIQRKPSYSPALLDYKWDTNLILMIQNIIQPLLLLQYKNTALFFRPWLSLLV